MRAKISAALLAVTAALLAALLAMSHWAGQQGYRNLLMVTPADLGAPGLSPEKLEEFSEEEFLLTYELRQASRAQAVQAAHEVTLVGTNHHCAGIMGYMPLDGGFFTKSAFDAGSRHAVLNEAAAFQLFGSKRISGSTLKLNGEAWIITGVVRDNDEEHANVYVPASVLGGQVKTVMVLMDQAAVTEAYVKNALKGVGIHENSYNYANLSKSASTFGERFAVAWKTALLAAILLYVLRAGGRLRRRLRYYRDRLRGVYLRELLMRHRADLAGTAAVLLSLAAGVAGMLRLSIGILETCLTWRELTPITVELAAGDFGGKLLWLRDWQGVGIALFAACVGMVLLCLALALRRKSANGFRLTAGQRSGYPVR